MRTTIWTSPRGALSRLAFPALVVMPALVAIRLIESDWGGSFGFAPAVSDLLTFVIVVVPAVLAIAALERVLPYDVTWNQSRGDIATDAVHMITGYVLQSVNRIALGAAGAVVAGILADRLGTGLWPAHIPLAAQLVLALLIGEVGHYWFHRLAHERPLLWRLHATHHSAQRLYWLNANRFQWLDIALLQTATVLPLIVLGMPRETFALYVIFVIVFGHLQHANVDFQTGWLSYLLSTPELHRFHHSTDAREGNTNYAGDLVIWDLAFGSFHLPRERFRGRLGIEGMPAFPQTFLAQQLSPLRWRSLAAQAGLRRAHPPSLTL